MSIGAADLPEVLKRAPATAAIGDSKPYLGYTNADGEVPISVKEHLKLVLNAKHFGAKGDNTTDDSLAVYRMMQEARGMSNAYDRMIECRFDDGCFVLNERFVACAKYIRITGNGAIRIPASRSFNVPHSFAIGYDEESGAFYHGYNVDAQYFEISHLTFLIDYYSQYYNPIAVTNYGKNMYKVYLHKLKCRMRVPSPSGDVWFIQFRSKDTDILEDCWVTDCAIDGPMQLTANSILTTKRLHILRNSCKGCKAAGIAYTHTFRNVDWTPSVVGDWDTIEVAHNHIEGHTEVNAVYGIYVGVDGDYNVRLKARRVSIHDNLINIPHAAGTGILVRSGNRAESYTKETRIYNNDVTCPAQDIQVKITDFLDQGAGAYSTQDPAEFEVYLGNNHCRGGGVLLTGVKRAEIEGGNTEDFRLTVPASDELTYTPRLDLRSGRIAHFRPTEKCNVVAQNVQFRSYNSSHVRNVNLTPPANKAIDFKAIGCTFDLPVAVSAQEAIYVHAGAAGSSVVCEVKDLETSTTYSNGEINTAAGSPTIRRWKNNLLYTTALPTAAAAFRGVQAFLQNGAGVKDHLYVCRKDAADAYGWEQLTA